VTGPDFDELIGEGLSEGERARLWRVHELLLAAGAPPELPPRLAEPPAPERRHEPEVQVLPRGIPRRRLAAAIVLAAALAAAAFGGGYLVGDRGEGRELGATRATLQMRGTPEAPDAFASLRIGERDDAGNWQMLLAVRGLYHLGGSGFYELLLTKKGNPVASCGTFNVSGKRTVVTLNAPYQLKEFDGWVVVRFHQPNEQGDVVLTT
jgi:hypothetical protein